MIVWGILQKRELFGRFWKKFAAFEDEYLVKNWLSEGLWKPGKGNNDRFNNKNFSKASLTT